MWCLYHDGKLKSQDHRQQDWCFGNPGRDFTWAPPALGTSCRSSSFSSSHWCSRMRLSPRGRQPARFSSPRTYATDVSKIFLLLLCMPKRKKLFFFFSEKNSSPILAQRKLIVHIHGKLGLVSRYMGFWLLINIYPFCPKATLWTSFLAPPTSCGCSWARIKLVPQQQSVAVTMPDT